MSPVRLVRVPCKVAQAHQLAIINSREEDDHFTREIVQGLACI